LRTQGAVEGYRTLSSLSGILNVHLAMEDRSLYPHPGAAPATYSCATLAQRFLNERARAAPRRYGRVIARSWSSAGG